MTDWTLDVTRVRRVGSRGVIPAAIRFERFVLRTDGCWLWMGYRGPREYGVFALPQRRVKAHRFAWEQAYGPIPAGMFVCHHCDNPPCVRPDHLFLGTHQDNMNDAKSKGRIPDHHGSNNGRAVLTPDLVASIRRDFAAGAPKRTLGRRHGVSPTTIGRAVKGENWKDVA